MENNIEWHQLVGVVGTVTYIGSYFIVQIGLMRAPGYAYCLVNILAASLVGVSLLYEFNLASAIIQVSWIMISLAGIICLLFSDKHRGKKNQSTTSIYHLPAKRT